MESGPISYEPSTARCSSPNPPPPRHTIESVDAAVFRPCSMVQGLFGSLLDSRTTAAQNCDAVPRRARIQESYTFVPITSKPESNKEEEALSDPRPERAQPGMTLEPLLYIGRNVSWTTPSELSRSPCSRHWRVPPRSRIEHFSHLCAIRRYAIMNNGSNSSYFRRVCHKLKLGTSKSNHANISWNWNHCSWFHIEWTDLLPRQK